MVLQISVTWLDDWFSGMYLELSVQLLFQLGDGALTLLNKEFELLVLLDQGV